jgi:hypothetical protein
MPTLPALSNQHTFKLIEKGDPMASQAESRPSILDWPNEAGVSLPSLHRHHLTKFNSSKPFTNNMTPPPSQSLAPSPLTRQEYCTAQGPRATKLASSRVPTGSMASVRRIDSRYSRRKMELREWFIIPGKRTTL